MHSNINNKEKNGYGLYLSPGPPSRTNMYQKCYVKTHEAFIKTALNRVRSHTVSLLTLKNHIQITYKKTANNMAHNCTAVHPKGVQ